MVSVCLPSDALLQHLPSYLGFSYLGVGYLFMAASAKHSCCSLPWTRDISLPPPFLAMSSSRGSYQPRNLHCRQTHHHQSTREALDLTQKMVKRKVCTMPTPVSPQKVIQIKTNVKARFLGERLGRQRR